MVEAEVRMVAGISQTPAVDPQSAAANQEPTRQLAAEFVPKMAT